MVGYVAVDLYWGRCGRDVALNVYWGRCGRVWCCRSLPWTILKEVAVYVCTGDVVVESGALYFYWGDCGRVWRCRFLMGTVY